MKRKIMTVTIGAAASLMLAAGPAAAHGNSAADKFIGPPLGGPGEIGHNGIQCAYDQSEAMTPIGDASALFTCKATPKNR